MFVCSVWGCKLTRVKFRVNEINGLAVLLSKKLSKCENNSGIVVEMFLKTKLM